MDSVEATPCLPRPQPIGVFPLPAGYLLIGPGTENDAVRNELLSGRRPEKFPPELRFYELALDGRAEEAKAALVTDTKVDRANRLVLDPDADALRELLIELRDPEDASLRGFVETVAFIVGLHSSPPSADSLDGEFAALAEAAHATFWLEARDTKNAGEALERAAQSANAVSKPMAGQLLGQLANCQLDAGDSKRACVTFQAALDAMSETDLSIPRAELHVAAGSTFQEMSEAAPRLMQQAINHYHQALALVTAESAPETFAVANANLGLAYITLPMNEASDQLRIGVAVQSMRDALKVFAPASHPDRWSSTQLNLANALVYMPSKHQADNIAEAIGLYEGVLQHRDRESDPSGRARVLANQGNALAHLGALDDAKSKLHEARALFEECEEVEAVHTVRSILDEIAKQESLLRQDR